MFEAMTLTQHINRLIDHINKVNEAQWNKIEELEKRIEMLENKG